MYSCLPFEFKRFSNDVLLVNECGDFLRISIEQFQLLVNKKFSEIDIATLHKLESRHFIVDQNHLATAIELSATKYRSRRDYLTNSTALHMMVVTLRCNHKCEYCQVSSADADAYKYDMSPHVAEKIVDLIFQSPSPVLKIEFQGGDALLNWQAVMAAVRHARKLNETKKKILEFVICTNLYALTHEHLSDIKEYNINISTSLDGPKCIHDKHRVLRIEGSSYDRFVENLKKARQFLGHNCASALMTTTNESIKNVKKIIDAYRELEFPGIVFRALNPYGDAYKPEMFYKAEDFFAMYKEGLEYIVELNRKGECFVEYFTALLLRRILTPFSTGFVDLQSPAGVGISGVIYDYDGNVYPADEARMLARMGNDKFKLGHVYTNTYKEIFLSPVLKEIVSSSCVETIPGCSSCVYRSYCGVDVFRNYLESGSIDNVYTDSFFCKKQTLIFDYLMERIQDPDFFNVVSKWVNV